MNRITTWMISLFLPFPCFVVSRLGGGTVYVNLLAALIGFVTVWGVYYTVKAITVRGHRTSDAQRKWAKTLHFSAFVSSFILVGVIFAMSMTGIVESARHRTVTIAQLDYLAEKVDRGEFAPAVIERRLKRGERFETVVDNSAKGRFLGYSHQLINDSAANMMIGLIYLFFEVGLIIFMIYCFLIWLHLRQAR